MKSNAQWADDFKFSTDDDGHQHGLREGFAVTVTEGAQMKLSRRVQQKPLAAPADRRRSAVKIEGKGLYIYLFADRLIVSEQKLM